MPFDGMRAQKQLRADLRIRQPLTGQTRDLRLLSRQLHPPLHRAPAHRLTGSLQLPTSPLGERLSTDPAEHLVGNAQLLTSIHTTILSPQPLAIDQVSTGELRNHRAAREPLERLAVA